MKIRNFSILFIAVLFLLNIQGCKKTAKTETGFKGDPVLKGKISYIVGYNYGIRMNKESIDIDEKVFFDAFKEGMAGGKSKYSNEEVQKIIAEMEEEMAKKMQSISAANKKAGEEFLAKNKSEKGVTVLASGLQYRVIKEGSGSMPKPTEVVKVNYTGKLLDGSEFDSSVKLGGPATFPVNGVIKGWQEALLLMKVGSKWEVFIPSELAYGEMGSQGAIPPNSTLIFEVELVGVEPK